MQVTDEQVRAIELSLADAIVLHDQYQADPSVWRTVVCEWSGTVQALSCALRTIKGDADTQFNIEWATSRLAQPDANQERANWPMWARQQQQATWLS
jgi:hypothetical protein